MKILKKSLFSTKVTLTDMSWYLKRHFEGEPKLSDFEIVSEELPPLKEGEILVKAEYISVDPSQRAFSTYKLVSTPYNLYSSQVGVVQESKDPKYPVGSRVVTYKGWSDYSIINMSASADDNIFGRSQIKYALPDLQGLPASLAVGPIGMPGASAYLAFMDLGKPKPGDTVVVTGAAGAVGTIAGQLAKIKGCKVIGFAGSDKKVQWLEKELGFDKAFNYKTVNIDKAISEAAPEGVDIYFDNVGGEISSTVMYHMKYGGRVLVIGSISSYNLEISDLPKVTILQPAILVNNLTVSAYAIFDCFSQWPEAFKELTKYIKSGQMKAPEHVTVGFDKVFDAFVGMLRGENFGKAVVKV